MLCWVITLTYHIHSCLFMVSNHAHNVKSRTQSSGATGSGKEWIVSISFNDKDVWTYYGFACFLNWKDTLSNNTSLLQYFPATASLLSNSEIIIYLGKHVHVCHVMFGLYVARKWDLRKAEQMFRQAMTYRQTMRLDHIIDEYDPPEVCINVASSLQHASIKISKCM